MFGEEGGAPGAAAPPAPAPPEGAAPASGGPAPPAGNNDLLGGAAAPPAGAPSGDMINAPDGNWYDKFEQYKDNPNINKYGSIEALMEGTINLSSKLGTDAKQRPGEGASPEDIQNWYNHIGRPESSDKYSEWAQKDEFDAQGNAVSPFEFNPDSLQQFKEFAHENGFTDDNYQKALDFYAQSNRAGEEAGIDAMVQQADQARANLSKDWGDKFDLRVQSANTVAENLGIKDTLVEAGLVNDESIIRALDQIGSKITEPGIIGAATPQVAGFKAGLEEMQKSPAWGNKSHPGWRDLEDRKMAHYKKYHGGNK